MINLLFILLIVFLIGKYFNETISVTIEQEGGSGKTCNICQNLSPGSPGANQYNYGLSVDCGCKGVTGDLLQKCGKVSTFDANDLALKNNFRQSTPQVINKIKDNWIPPHLISKLHYVGPHKVNEVNASNQNLSECPANFGSEKTNLEQYFKANPDLYEDIDKFSTFTPYVPFTQSWTDKSDCFNNIAYYSNRTAPSHFIVNKI